MIYNPNAPEMVHILFEPLELVVSASRDQVNGVSALAVKVALPRLSAAAVRLLGDCLSSRESELWSSLGDAWTVSQ